MGVAAGEEDGIWAWRLGLRYGAWHPKPDSDLLTLGDAWVKYADPYLNDATVAAGARYFGVWHEGFGEDDLTEDQLRELRPMLEELTTTATYGFEAAIYFRRAMVLASYGDPRITDPDEDSISSFARQVSAFLDDHPDLTFHLQGIIRSEPDSAVDASAPRPDPPAPQPYGVSHAGAEHLVAAWMRHLGALDAQPTQVSGDGGIDVISSGYIAQVKNLATGTTVPVAHIRDLAGVAHVDGRKAAMFTSGIYSSGGSEFADRAGIALFRYDAVRGILTPANNHATRARVEGMG